MTQQATSPLLSLQATSGRKWHLTPLHNLTPTVRVVRDVAKPNLTFAVKTVSLPDENAVRLVLSDAAAWRRVSIAAPNLVVRLMDVAQDALTVHFIMEYCPGGAMEGVVKSERAALRCVATVAGAVEAVLVHGGGSAHANLSSAHVLLDENGGPKLGGWGYTRAKRLANPRRRLSERDDVKALAAVLFEILYGRRYDVEDEVLPNEPRVSKATADLLKAVLFGRGKNVPELTVFRYDVAAARRLVPVCTAALKPIVNSRREEFLGNDLDSIRGLEGGEESVERREEDEGEDVNGKVAVEHRSAPVTNGVQRGVNVTVAPVLKMEDLSDVTVAELVKKVVSAEVEPFDMEDVERIVDACAQTADLPEKVFKVLFTLPISKNPVVAYKTMWFLHHLLAEGPAKLTALAITHDGFLNWAQSQWTPERLQAKVGKMHMLSYCFSGGEIAWYTAMLRKRIEAQARFAQVFSTHWVPRPNGMTSLGGGRKDAVRFVVEVVEKSAALLRKVLPCTDPVTAVKQGAIPVIVTELAKAYQVVCWLYATADAQQKVMLGRDLEVAHVAARAALEAIRARPDIASVCPSNALLELGEQVPQEFDVSALFAALRKKRKKKKKKKAVLASEEPEPVQNDEPEPETIVDEEPEPVPNGRSKSPVRLEIEDEQKRRTSEDEEDSGGDDADEEASPEEAPQREVPPKRSVIARRDENGRRDPVGTRQPYGPRLNGDIRHARPVESTLPQGQTRNGELSATAKLSLSVRGAGSRHENGFRRPLGPQSARGRSLSPVLDRRRRLQPRTVEDRVYYSQSDSDDTAPGVRSNESAGDIRPRRRRGSSRRARSSSRDSETSESDSEHDGEITREKRQPVRPRKVKAKKQKDAKDGSAESSESEGSDADRKKRRPVKRRSLKKKPSDEKKTPTDEKKIPFDKETPARKKANAKAAAKAAAQKEEEYTGGSKEALAAAASGKKTPTMNPKFEVAPYEVQYGPQIGSGGFGVVFKAKFRGETVAVKKIHAHALSNAASVSEFQSEVAVLCTLRHPNILRFVGACTKPPHLMIITEFMPRGTLFDVLHQSQMRVTWPMRKKFALDTCKGMRYLHDSKLLHRDLKSSNLMLDKDFNCKVGDFGLTRISRGSAAVQMTGQCGTFQYMAVEVLANKPYSEKADVFSFGILLWEMVARKLPYFGMQPMQVGIAVLQQGMRPPIPAKCPAPLAKLMRACWDSDPSRRPSFSQLVQALEAMPE